MQKNFSEYQEMAAPTFLFIKVNYAFTHQNFNPSLLINKTIVKKRKETVSFRFLIRKYRPEKTCNYRQKVVDKFTKLSKIGFSMGCFAADVLWLASENFKNWLQVSHLCKSFQKQPLMLSVLFIEKSCSLSVGLKSLRNTCGGVHFLVKLHVEDRQHY